MFLSIFLKRVFLFVTILFVFGKSFSATSPIGLTNSSGICYANSVLQTILVAPKVEQQLENLNNENSKLFLNFVKSYKAKNPNNELKMRIIRSVMPNGFSFQSIYDFLMELFRWLNLNKNVSSIEELKKIGFFNIINRDNWQDYADVNAIIVNIDNAHYKAYVKYEQKWFCVDDSIVSAITQVEMQNFFSKHRDISVFATSEKMSVAMVEQAENQESGYKKIVRPNKIWSKLKLFSYVSIGMFILYASYRIFLKPNFKI